MNSPSFIALFFSGLLLAGVVFGAALFFESQRLAITSIVVFIAIMIGYSVNNGTTLILISIAIWILLKFALRFIGKQPTRAQIILKEIERIRISSNSRRATITLEKLQK
ncbi:hypothetical protein [Limnohabitans sp.]|jgi:hypothetical protein|uniref:hypothetical protein n=1 Tax=Limnohabitans sp. TaxID=1907725 RepID=UPI0037C074A5